MTQGQSIERLQPKVMVVEDYVTLQKKIRNHLQKQGLENLVIADNEVMPQVL